MYKKEYVYKEFIRQEDNVLRAPYNPELEFYSVIKSGDVEKTRQLVKADPFTKKLGLGKLSSNNLQNFKYHLVITIAIIARYCIDGGMDLSTAYSLSDFYIQQADEAKKIEELDKIHLACVSDYARRMKSLRKNKICSMPVVKCIDYIYDHLHTKITSEILADYVGVSTPYLCRIFKQETHQTISEFVQSTKIETAQNMLIYSDYSPAEIASILAYPSQSYFTEIFRKRVGVPPKKYQSQHIRETDFSNMTF